MAYTVEMEDILETVTDFGTASIELVAWEFDAHVDDLKSLWEQATIAGLIEPAGSNELGEPIWSLSAEGKRVWTTVQQRARAGSLAGSGFLTL